MPASTIISVSACASAGTNCAGLNTTEFPKASAGAIFHAGIDIGKFHGSIRPTTPTADRETDTSIPGRVELKKSTFWRSNS